MYLKLPKQHAGQISPFMKKILLLFHFLSATCSISVKMIKIAILNTINEKQPAMNSTKLATKQIGFLTRLSALLKFGKFKDLHAAIQFL